MDNDEFEMAVRDEWRRDLKVAIFRAAVGAAYLGFGLTLMQDGVTDREFRLILGVGAVFAVAVISAGWVANGARRD